MAWAISGEITPLPSSGDRLDGGVPVRLNRGHALSSEKGTPAEGVEAPHVAEVHDADHQGDTADLGRKHLHDLAAGRQVAPGGSHEEGQIAEVEEVEPDHQQLVDGVGQTVVA